MNKMIILLKKSNYSEQMSMIIALWELYLKIMKLIMIQ